MCRVAQENGACLHKLITLIQRTKCNFLSINGSMISSLSKTKFVVQVPAYWEITHTRSEVNLLAIPEIQAFKKLLTSLFLFFMHVCEKKLS